MDDERSVIDRLDSIEATNESTKKMVAQILDILSEDEPEESIQQQPQQRQPQPSNQDILQTFLKQSKKSWRWFGNKAEFEKRKRLAVVSLIVLLAIGLITSIVSTICFKMYSTFTFFENAWMVFGIIYLVYAVNAKQIYEVNELAANSSTKYLTDNLGMKFPRKEKVVFRIFKWLAIISVICNIICIWGGMGKTLQAFATIMEVLFLAAIIFAFFMNLNLFAQYSIIWVEGHNLTTKVKVVLVLPPGAKELMTEEEFKKKMPFVYE